MLNCVFYLVIIIAIFVIKFKTKYFLKFNCIMKQQNTLFLELNLLRGSDQYPSQEIKERLVDGYSTPYYTAIPLKCTINSGKVHH